MDGAGMNKHAVEFVFNKNVSNELIIANIRANAGRDLPYVDFKRICICASGPSLADYLDEIKDRQAQGWHVASMNGSHNYLIENGIVPDFMFMVDARPVNLPFLDKANDHTAYIIASQCQPDVIEALKGRKDVLWQVHHCEGADIAIQESLGEKRCPIFIGAVNVGPSCLGPILAMGYRCWALFGYDGSIRDGQKHAFDQPQNAGEEIMDFCWPMNADGSKIEGVSKEYWATPTMAHAAQLFVQRYNAFRGIGIEIELRCEGLLPDMARMMATAAPVPHGPKAPERRIPEAKPRSGTVDRLPIVSFLWKGHIPYGPQDVQCWANQVSRHLGRPHELVCVTDQPETAQSVPGVRVIPMWRDHFEHGRDWHRLRLFSEEMADIIGPRFVCMDLDTVICGGLDPLFDNDHPFMAWRDPNRDQYCTALFMMDAGAFPHVWETFDPQAALALRTSGMFGGYDQAWISYALPGQPRWTAEDGVLSFRVDVLGGKPLHAAPLPSGARVINFHGKHNPRDPDVQAACPWIADYYR